MKLGTRITLTTTALVMIGLTTYGVVWVRVRRAELTAELERRTVSLGHTLRVALEAALQEGLYEDVRRLVARLAAVEPQVRIAYVELVPGTATPRQPEVALPDAESGAGSGRYEAPPADPTREERIRRVVIDGAPLGEHRLHTGRPTYVYTVPLRDEQNHVAAVVDIAYDESAARAELKATEQRVVLTVVGVALVLALLAGLGMRRALSRPLKRLVEGIDDVAVGDLTRVILRERDDEIGELAERFNQMTTSLREARAETERGHEAKLNLEARLRHSEKLATIGQLAASLAHEVGTPLSVIHGRARGMEKKAAEALRSAEEVDAQAMPGPPAAIDPAEVAKNAGIIAAQAARITKIIQRLLAFARQNTAAQTTIDLAAVVRDTVDFLEHQLGQAHVRVEMLPFLVEPGEAGIPGAGTPAEPQVVGDADQLQQVCINLCVNAIQAMPEGGTLTLGLGGVVRRKPGLDVAPPGRFIVFSVRDSGVGIPVEERERVFEPFYSTKQARGGTGLGLAVAQGIVKDHDGWIEVEAPDQGGTCFRVYLPAAAAADI